VSAREWPVWAGSDNRLEGRFADIRCTCKLNGHVLRKQTLRATTQFFRGASAAKVGSEPFLLIFCIVANGSIRIEVKTLPSDYR
jgi:hypothetical protein